MKLVGLISGGKDSSFNILQCIAAGHEIVALANIEPEAKDDLDSYMYQTVGHEAVSLVAGAIGLPLFRQKTRGKAICKNKNYIGTSDDEVEDLFELLSKVKKNVFIEGVSVGAIASDYQRTRVENVCSRLGLKSFAYMWRRDQAELLQEMIDADLNAIIIKVACIGLNPNIHLGMNIRDLQPYLLDLNRQFGVNICGEGGEYETLTLDCPLYLRMISITDSEKVISTNDALAPVGFLTIKNASLLAKNWETSDPVLSLQSRLKHVRSSIKNPYSYIQDCVDDVTQTLFPERPERALAPDLPFPFEIEETNEDESLAKFKEYWKNSQDSKPTPTANQFLLNKFTRCNLSYLTGWCFIGNIISSTLLDALQCLQRNLERNLYEFHDVVFVNLFVKDLSEFAGLNKMYSHYMPEVLPPARVCVETNLPPEANVIMSVVAHKNISRSHKAIHPTCSSDREAMHVQSISHWAPANIGPYSQCIKIGGIYYLAGQIPLVPGTMEILNKPIFHQCRLALRHVIRILQAMNGSLTFSNVMQAICYVTSDKIASDIHHIWTYITGESHATVTAVVVTALPKNAQLEWEIVACSFERPLVSENNCNLEDFVVDMKRCVYTEPFVSSSVCKISPLKRGQKKNSKILTAKTLDMIIKQCVDFTRSTASFLCMLKIFYKAGEPLGVKVVNDVVNSFGDAKVVATAIPVLGFEDSEVFVVIVGEKMVLIALCESLYSFILKTVWGQIKFNIVVRFAFVGVV